MRLVMIVYPLCFFDLFLFFMSAFVCSLKTNIRGCVVVRTAGSLMTVSSRHQEGMAKKSHRRGERNVTWCKGEPGDLPIHQTCGPSGLKTPPSSTTMFAPRRKTEKTRAIYGPKRCTDTHNKAQPDRRHPNTHEKKTPQPTRKTPIPRPFHKQPRSLSRAVRHNKAVRKAWPPGRCHQTQGKTPIPPKRPKPNPKQLDADSLTHSTPTNSVDR